MGAARAAVSWHGALKVGWRDVLLARSSCANSEIGLRADYSHVLGQL